MSPTPQDMVEAALAEDAAMRVHYERMRTALIQIATGAAEAYDGLTYDEIAKIASFALRKDIR